MNTQFTEYTPSTPAKIVLTTPGGKKVDFFHYDPKIGGAFNRFNGMFQTGADFEYAYNLCTIAHVHCLNRETNFEEGSFEVEITIGCGEDAERGSISLLTLDQVFEFIDRDDIEFAKHLLENRTLHNRRYWPKGTIIK